MRPYVELRGIAKSYDDGLTKALRAVELSVSEGELVAIVGRSGSGKSTLLNVLGLLDRPERGEYVLGGEPVHKADQRRRSAIRAEAIGFIFQDSHLIPYLTVGENVDLSLSSVPNQRTEPATVVAGLASVGLSEKLTAAPSTLSGGERQRVAALRAVVKKPKLLLCDEPTGNLDSESRDRVFNLIKEAVGGGASAILVTHDSELADRCDRQLRLHDGELSD